MRGCLLIHGATSSPAILVPLRDALMAKGFEVSMPLLAGHGGSIDDFDKVTWRDWYESVRVAYQELRRNVDKVYYAGISLGAILGLKLAAEEGWGVRALALMSLPLDFSFFTKLKIGAVRYSPARWLLRSIKKDFRDSVSDPKLRESYKDLALGCMPLSSIYQIVDLQKNVRSVLNKVANPLLLLYGMRDTTSPPSNAEILKKTVASDVVETEFYERSSHILTMDWDSDDVRNRIVNFFERFA